MRALALGLMCVLAVPAFAKDVKPKVLHDRPAACKLTYDGELKDARDVALKHPVGVYPIGGADAVKFLGIFNSVEPKTDYKADQILVMLTPEVAFVELFQDGCVNHYGKLPPVAFEALMTQAFGGDVVGGEWM